MLNSAQSLANIQVSFWRKCSMPFSCAQGFPSLDPEARLGNVGAFRPDLVERIGRSSRVSPDRRNTKLHAIFPQCRGAIKRKCRTATSSYNDEIPLLKRQIRRARTRNATARPTPAPKKILGKTQNNGSSFIYLFIFLCLFFLWFFCCAKRLHVRWMSESLKGQCGGVGDVLSSQKWSEAGEASAAGGGGWRLGFTNFFLIFFLLGWCLL